MQHALTAARTAHRAPWVTTNHGITWCEVHEVSADDLHEIDDYLGGELGTLAEEASGPRDDSGLRYEPTTEDLRTGLRVYLAMHGDLDASEALDRKVR